MYETCRQASKGPFDPVSIFCLSHTVATQFDSSLNTSGKSWHMALASLFQPPVSELPDIFGDAFFSVQLLRKKRSDVYKGEPASTSYIMATDESRTAIMLHMEKILAKMDALWKEGSVLDQFEWVRSPYHTLSVVCSSSWLVFLSTALTAFMLCAPVCMYARLLSITSIAP